LKALLLGDISESKSEIEPSQQVSDKSIVLQFTQGEYGKELHSSPLVLYDTIHQIAISSQWVMGRYGGIFLILERDEKEIAS